MANALSLEEFGRYAREAVTAVDAILHHGHQPRAGSWCSCGRARPCPQADSLYQRREHFQTQLALAEQTVVLPAVAVGGSPRRGQHRRAGESPQ